MLRLRRSSWEDAQWCESRHNFYATVGWIWSTPHNYVIDQRNAYVRPPVGLGLLPLQRTCCLPPVGLGLSLPLSTAHVHQLCWLHLDDFVTSWSLAAAKHVHMVVISDLGRPSSGLPPASHMTRSSSQSDSSGTSLSSSGATALWKSVAKSTLSR